MAIMDELAKDNQDVIQKSSQSPQETRENSSEEKTYSPKEVGELVSRIREETRKKTYEKARNELMDEFQQASTQLNQSKPEPQRTLGGMAQLSENDIRRMISDETQKHYSLQAEQQEKSQREAMGKQIASSFINKMVAGKDKYPDIEEKLAELNLPAIAHVVAMVEPMDNAADIMMELVNKPHKLGNLLNLSQQPHLARRMLNDLSTSIKKNEEGAQVKLPRDPLSTIKPSVVGLDNGNANNLTVQDFRKRYKG